MAKYIYNITEEAKTYQGREIPAGEFYLISDNLLPEYSSDSILIADLANGTVKMSSNGTSALNGTGSDHVDFLKNSTPPNIASSNYPFASKILPNGKKIYTRIHGVVASVQNAPDNIDFVVPYAQCKVTCIEIIGGKIGDKANFKVLDSDGGIITGVPNYLLNQFGFNVNVSADLYEYVSQYDADLVEDLILRVEYDAVDELLPRNVYINFILHEVKD